MATAPHLVQLHDKYAAQGLKIIGVTQETVPTAMAFATARKWDDKIPIAVDENKVVGRRYSVDAYPTTVIMDRRGIVQWRGVGAQPAAIEAKILEYLNPPAADSGK